MAIVPFYDGTLGGNGSSRDGFPKSHANYITQAKLNVSEQSIRNYIYRIFEKLGVSNRVELLLYCFSDRDSEY